jgi:hypothetical protein
MSGGSVGLFEGKRIGRAKNLEKLSKDINNGENLILKLKNIIAAEEIKLKDLTDSSQKDFLQQSQLEINRLSNEYTSVKTKQEQYLAFIENSLNRKQDIEQKMISISNELLASEPLLAELKIKRQINNENVTSTFLFKLNNPYIVFYGGGDMKDDIYGNLIIKLKLPNNITWSNEFIFIEQNITLYEMVYGLNINLDLGEEIIKFDNWIPCRDGIFIQINEYIKLKLILVLTEEQILALTL